MRGSFAASRSWSTTRASCSDGRVGEVGEHPGRPVVAAATDDRDPRCHRRAFPRVDDPESRAARFPGHKRADARQAGGSRQAGRTGGSLAISRDVARSALRAEAAAGGEEAALCEVLADQLGGVVWYTVTSSRPRSLILARSTMNLRRGSHIGQVPYFGAYSGPGTRTPGVGHPVALVRIEAVLADITTQDVDAIVERRELVAPRRGWRRRGDPPGGRARAPRRVPAARRLRRRATRRRRPGSGAPHAGSSTRSDRCGAGGAHGEPDAARLVLPAVARGR